MSGESPSPFVLTAPLMPPWAQTEWLRLTGTIEKRSTPIPISAARTAVMSPARPPPTMTIRSPLTRGPLNRQASGVRRQAKPCPSQAERLNSPHADVGEDEEDGGRDVQHAALRLRADRQAPHDRKGPDAVGEMESGREDAGGGG